jgi:hypothetical protein
MARKQVIVILLIILLVPSSFAVKRDSTKVSLNHYSLTIGAGWTHYINSLVIGKDNATINSAGLSLKFFWEPEHRLSLGLESGYYRLYKVKSPNYADDHIQATMTAVPLLLCIRMRIVDHFYLGAGAGLAVMYNNVTAKEVKVSSKIWSLSNYRFSGSYIYPLGKHWLVGGEIGVINFGKAEDWIYSVQALCAVRL